MQPFGPQFLPPGTVLGKYELIKGLAVGGMAELYLARMRAIGSVQRLVALKRILPNYAAEQEFVHMFLDEARLTAKLQHPNIGQVFDIGTSPHGLFFTMEYISGENARTLLRTAASREQRLPLGLALSIVIQIARGLHYAHEQRGTDGESLGVVHRDISPSNVIISFDGNAKLIDFGVAKARGRFAETRTGVVKGKVSYMSPEQCQGEELDRRSDVFALGILLHELTTNQRLFREANEFLVLRRIIDEDAPPPSQKVPNYPLALEGIVQRALARNLDERYQSAEELADALTAFVAENGLDTSKETLAAYMRNQFSDSLRTWRDTVIQLASRPDMAIQPARASTNGTGSAAWTMRAPSAELQPAVSGTVQAGARARSEAYADLQIAEFADETGGAGATEISASARLRAASHNSLGGPSGQYGSAPAGQSTTFSNRGRRWSPKVVIGAAAVLAALVAVAAAQSGEPAVATSAPAVTIEADEAPSDAPDQTINQPLNRPEQGAETPTVDAVTELATHSAPTEPSTESGAVSAETDAPGTETDEKTAHQPVAERPGKQSRKSRKDRTSRKKKNRRSRRHASRNRTRQSSPANDRGSDAAWDPDAALPP